MDVSRYSDQKPVLKIENFFVGKLKAYGLVMDRSGKVTRRFEADLLGTVDGNKITLDETFIWSDGEKQKRIWTITKTGENTYDGAAGDVVGIAKGKASGNAFQFLYTLDVPVKGSSFHIKMDDWMYLINDRVLINHTIMTKFGFKVGELMITIERI